MQMQRHCAGRVPFQTAAARSAKYPVGRGRIPSNASSSVVTRPARSPCISVSTSARRTRSAGGSSPWSAACRSARSRPVSPSRIAARSEAAKSPSAPPSSAVSASRSCSAPAAPSWKTESSHRSSASPRSGSSSAAGSRSSRSRASLPRNWSSRVGLAGRDRGRDRQHGPDPVRAPVEPLEENRACGDRARGGEPQRGHRVGQLARRVRGLAAPRRQGPLELEHADAIGLAAEVLGQQAAGLGPVRRELTGRRSPHADAVAELDRRAEREPDQRRDRRVGVLAAEERDLELGVGALEGAVLPVEAAAALGGRNEERQQHAVEERRVLARRGPGVRAREDRSGGLAAQILEREPRVLARHEPVGPPLDVAAHERSVLVQRGPPERRMLLEGERQLGPPRDLFVEEAEGAETEAAERAMDVRSAYRHSLPLRPARLLSCLFMRKRGSVIKSLDLSSMVRGRSKRTDWGQELNIAALSRRTGVAPDTLRKWEQRYGVLNPSRTDGGQRRYSELDVARVEWLLARLDEGYRIGEAAALLGDGPTRAPDVRRRSAREPQGRGERRRPHGDRAPARPGLRAPGRRAEPRRGGAAAAALDRRRLGGRRPDRRRRASPDPGAARPARAAADRHAPEACAESPSSSAARASATSSGC